ncbi:MAG: ECF transporter S component [Lachnospiraceae bacterium]
MKKLFTVKNLVLMALFTAIAEVLMLFEFPIPFIAPSFYEMDFSEVPVLIGTFTMGPLAGVIIELLKILLNFLINGTTTAGVGEIGNFLIGCALVVPAGIIYQVNRTKKGAVIAMISGTVSMAVIGCFVNAYLLLPWYAANMFGSMEPIIELGKAVHQSVDNVLSFAVMLVVPFNLIKGCLVSVLTFLLYKRIGSLIKKF